jgi:hypothetical protein
MGASLHLRVLRTPRRRRDRAIRFNSSTPAKLDLSSLLLKADPT